MQIRKLVSLVLAGIMFSATGALPQNQVLPSGTGRPKLASFLRAAAHWDWLISESFSGWRNTGYR